MASLPLLPESGPRLVGIARLAAHGESVREGHDIEYFTLPVRSLLNRCVSKRQMPFTWTINPYRGCEFACRYCYARYTHEFMEMRDAMDFERKIYVKQQAAALLRHDLRRVKAHEPIALGTATDPYQPAERRYEVTRAILEEFSRHRGFELSIVTKSNLIVRDLELLKEVAKTNRLSVHINHPRCRTGAHSRASRSASRPSHRRRAHFKSGGIARRRELFAGRTRNHRFPQGPRSRHTCCRRSGRRLRFRESTFSEALLGGCLPSLP